MHRVLGVFAKEPVAGQVKTRLAAVIGAEQAARLYEAFLRDLLARLERLPVRRVLAYTPDSGKDYFGNWLGDRFELEPQSGSDLGERMSAFFERQFSRDARQVVLVGSDAPNLPIARIEQAFAELVHHDVVLGPSDDGGYYLVGMRRMIVEVFGGIEWSTSGVFDRTLQRLSELGIQPALLESWYDIDRPEDLFRLFAQMDAARRLGQDPELLHTQTVLQCLPHVDRVGQNPGP